MALPIIAGAAAKIGASTVAKSAVKMGARQIAMNTFRGGSGAGRGDQPYEQYAPQPTMPSSGYAPDSHWGMNS
jgi:hypothetical protein